MADWVEGYWELRRKIEGIAKTVTMGSTIGEYRLQRRPMTYFGVCVTPAELNLVEDELKECGLG